MAVDLPISTLALGAVLIFAVAFALRPRRARFAAPLPPAPKTSVPLIGHTLMMSGVKYAWVSFYEIWKSMGEEACKSGVMYMKLGNGPNADTLIINTCKATQDLLEKKSGLYSDRPRMIVPQEYISNNRRMVLTRYNDRWRQLRKFLHTQLHDKLASTYEPVQDLEAKALALSFLEDPEHFADHIQLFSSNVILQIAYARRARDVNDKAIQGMIHSIESWSTEALPGARFVADFPILDYLPAFISPWKRNAMHLHQLELDLFNTLTGGVRRKMAAGELPECLMRHLLEHQKSYGFDDELVQYTAGTLFEAGSDTTTSLTTSLVLAATNNNEFWQKAKEEVDRVVGADRMPTFADSDDLPYIVAIGKELQRWRPAVPAAVPHALTEDDEYMGFHLPKGSTVICNTWGIGRDKAVFPDGETFRPERYLGEEGKKIAAALNKGHTGFGFARRICPGLHVAERSLLIVIATLAWGFELGPKANEPRPDVFNFSEGFVSRANPFRAEITARDARRARMITQEGKEALRQMENLYEDDL